MRTAAIRQDEEEDMNDAVKNLRDNARRTKEDLRDAVDTIRDDAESIAHEAGRQVRQVVNDAEKKVIAASKTVSDSIHANPMQSSLIALGVGVFLGMLFRRS